MSDGSEQQGAEALDDDVVGGIDVPPDEPYALADLVARDVETVGDEAMDSVAERSAREEPDLEVNDPVAIPTGLVDPGPDGGTDLAADPGEPDAEDVIVLSDEVPPRPEDPSPEAGALHVVDDDGRQLRP